MCVWNFNLNYFLKNPFCRNFQKKKHVVLCCTSSRLGVVFGGILGRLKKSTEQKKGGTHKDWPDMQKVGWAIYGQGLY